MPIYIKTDTDEALLEAMAIASFDGDDQADLTDDDIYNKPLWEDCPAGSPMCESSKHLQDALNSIQSAREEQVQSNSSCKTPQASVSQSNTSETTELEAQTFKALASLGTDALANNKNSLLDKSKTLFVASTLAFRAAGNP